MRKESNLAAEVIGQGTNTLRDIKPPVHIPTGWEWAWWVTGALVLSALAYWGWHWWQKRRAALPPKVIIPAHVMARKRLEEALALISHPKPFCIAVSDAIRWYLEERFQFRAPERTTEEFLHELGGTTLLSSDQKRSLSEFLEKCDLVKFAKYEPGELELRQLHASALRLVDETVPPSTPSGSTPAEQSPSARMPSPA